MNPSPMSRRRADLLARKASREFWCGLMLMLALSAFTVGVAIVVAGYVYQITHSS